MQKSKKGHNSETTSPTEKIIWIPLFFTFVLFFTLVLYIQFQNPTSSGSSPYVSVTYGQADEWTDGQAQTNTNMPPQLL